MPDPSVEPEPVEPEPAVAAELFGSRLGLARDFARLLVTDGVVRGLIGPREPGRIWSRHLLNCAVVSDLFAQDSTVVDVGSGAGLPGVALAIRRPDLRVTLVEPLERRALFLQELVGQLGLEGQVRVLAARAESTEARSSAGGADWVTARAVAPLPRLVEWCLPLTASDGRLALMKGATAAKELEAGRAAVLRAGARDPHLERCGEGQIEPPVTVVVMRRNSARPARGRR